MANMKITSVTIEVAAGEYWVGDPCYVVPDEEWHNYCESFHETLDIPIGVTSSGVQVMAFRTRYGDGVYYDKQGRGYPVDSGTIGLVPVEAFPEPADGLMHKIELKNPTPCFTEDGIIFIGSIAIDTDPQESVPKEREEFIRRGGMVTWGKPKSKPVIDEALFVDEPEDADDDS